jgi:hypothetical protein
VLAQICGANRSIPVRQLVPVKEFMKYRYLAAFIIDGITLPAPVEITLLNTPDSRANIMLTSRPDAYLGPADVLMALSRRVRISVAGAPPPPPVQDLASLVQIARAERAAPVNGRPVLVVDVIGDRDFPNRSPNTPLDEIVFTVVDKQVVKDISKLHEKLIGQALASLALLAAPIYGLKKLSDFVLLDPASPSPVHVSPAGIDIKIAFRSSMPTELKESIESRFADLLGVPDLETVMRLYADSLIQNEDYLRSFLAAWTAIEVFTNKVFGQYEKDGLPISKDELPDAMLAYLDRIREVMKGKYTLVNKFTLISYALDLPELDPSVAKFEEAKKQRDWLLHGEQIEERLLPTSDVQRLLLELVLRHLRRQSR